MSASNWQQCPRCLKEAHLEKGAREKKAEEAYGKASPAEYNLLIKEAAKPVKTEDTLREDWELGVNSDGLFEVSYYCSCERCGFKYQYKHTEQVKV